jgi:serine/threonine protein kinase
VRDEAVDHRTDIFAFGAVLYEMLSGERDFQRNSSVKTMAAILKEEPPQLVAIEQRHISPALEKIVRRAWRKIRRCVSSRLRT